MIATFEHNYPVICVRESTRTYDSYICRNADGDGACSVLAIKDRRYFTDTVDRLTKTVNKNVFTDFLESFVCDDKLCVVMRYRQGITLETKLATEMMVLAERLEIGRKILEKIILQEIPDYFLAKCSSTKNIIVGNDMSVYFNYPLEDIADAGKYNSAVAMACVSDILHTLFASELERKAPAVMMSFFKRLPELLEDGSVVDAYCAYNEMMSKIADNDTGEEPKTFWFIAWEKIKVFASHLKKIIMVALILIALGFLVYTIITAGASNEKSSNFDSIGTVKIIS